MKQYLWRLRSKVILECIPATNTMKVKKSIAFFGIKYFPSRGGTSRVAENLILNLANDFNITVYCYKNKSAKTHIKGVNVIEFPQIKLGGIGVFLYYCTKYKF